MMGIPENPKNNILLVLTAFLLVSISVISVHTSAVKLVEYEVPPNGPYVIMGTLYDVDGVTPVANATIVGIVRVVNGTEHERLEETTGPNGEYAFTFGLWQSPPAGDIAIISVVHGNAHFEEVLSFDNPNHLVHDHDIILKENIDDSEPEYLLPLEVVAALGGSLIILGVLLVLHFKKKGANKKGSEVPYPEERKRSNE